MSRTLQLLFALLIAASCPIAFAHGNATHAAGQEKPAEQTDWGIAGTTTKKPRTIKITMDDTMRFVPARITVGEGETVRLQVHNGGAQLHELVIGTSAALTEHADLMLRFPQMEHDEPWMAHIAPGKTGEIAWTFNRAGQFEFACLVAGHYQAGMRGTILVSPKTGK